MPVSLIVVVIFVSGAGVGGGGVGGGGRGPADRPVPINKSVCVPVLHCSPLVLTK